MLHFKKSNNLLDYNILYLLIYFLVKQGNILDAESYFIGQRQIRIKTRHIKNAGNP